MRVHVNGRSIDTGSAQSVGQGREVEVYRLDHDTALAVFKPSSHPDFSGLPDEQQAARARLREYQEKLPAFPDCGDLTRLVYPQNLAREGRRVTGYTMQFVDNAEVLLRYSEKGFRAAVPANKVVEIFRKLSQALLHTHHAGIVVGDFNDLNVLVRGEDVFLIDTHSMQFGCWYCKLFTEKFVDPLLCDPDGKRPMLVQPHNSDSDWFAFSQMYLQSLLFVDAWGGIHKPADKRDRVSRGRRPLERISIFHPEVKIPKKANPIGVLPDDLLQYFEDVFERDRRGVFPKDLMEIRWTTCDRCGTEHARGICPVCKKAHPIAVTETIRGKIVVKPIFRTAGTILHATMQDGLKWLVWENGKYKREDGEEKLSGQLDPQVRYRIQGNETLYAKGGTLIVNGKRVSVDTLGSLPIFDTNSQNYYWTYNGQLLRSGDFAPKYIGDVLQSNTLFWVGERFGFGFYRAGKVCVYFVFPAGGRGINDSVVIPPLRGQLVDSSCEFSSRYAWFFVTTQEGAGMVNRCCVVDEYGNVVASAEEEAGARSWLGQRIRGNTATGKMLFAATDDGLVRVEPRGGGLHVTKEFPDTEPWVDTGAHLFVSAEGIYVVKQKEIVLISMR